MWRFVEKLQYIPVTYELGGKISEVSYHRAKVAIHLFLYAFQIKEMILTFYSKICLFRARREKY